MNNVMIILMNRLTRTLLSSSFCLLVCTLHAAPLRLVCIGDSITQGRGDHSNGGAQWTPTFSYRYPLWKRLVDAGADVDFVGSLKSGFEGDPNWLAALKPFSPGGGQPQPAAPAKPEAATGTGQSRRVYFIGNSVTDTVRYGSLAKLAAARGVKLDWGRTMIPGAPLEWLYTHPTDGFREEPYGTWTNALNHFVWDAVSLQPFDRHLHGKDKDGRDLGDVPLIKEFAGMAARKNPEVQVYIYARWPRVTSGGKGMPFDKNDYDPAKPGSGNDLSKVDDFTARWEARYSGGWDNSNESRDYFETLLREVRKETSFLKKKPLLVPAGHVMNALHVEMKAGRVPGYTSIHQLYKDGIHLNEAGSYLVGCTYFATLLKQSPVGLPSAPYGRIDPALAETIQKTVWQVVSVHPEAGAGTK